MSTNLLSRSASASQSSGSKKSGGLRSASIGSSNFFNKDGLSFFSLDHSGSADDLISEIKGKDFSLEARVPSELDIVGALGTLNLDEDFDEGSDPKSPNSSTSTSKSQAIKSSTPFAQPQILPTLASVASPVGATLAGKLGSLTPQPAPVSGFGSAHAVPGSLNTPPTNSWTNTFVPLSAPPFAFPVEDKSADIAMGVTPLELPDDKPDSSALHSAEIPAPHHSDLMSMSSQPLHPLGGVLDSRFAFGNFFNVPGMNYGPENPGGQFSHKDAQHYGADNNNVLNDKGGEQVPAFDVGSTDQSNALPHPGTATMWSQHPSFLNPQFMSARPPQNLDARMMPNPMGQFDNGHPNFINPALQPRYKDSGFLNYANNGPGPGPSSGGSQPRHHNGNRRHPNMNLGVNVHRKMHNSNRRKGDDASKYANAKLEDFTGEIYSLCKDQHGCRFLQRQLDLGSEAAERTAKSDLSVMTNVVAATVIFNEIYLKVVELMTDPFGNYLIQKLAENVSPDQRLILVKNAAPEFVRIALDPHGTRALQKLVECISTTEEIQQIIKSLAPHIVTLSRDLNGNHVVQKCLQKLSPENNLFIFDTTSAHCTEIATHRHGCCVLQRCLDHGNDEQRKQLSLKVAENATRLASDPFGNYVVQYVLSRGDSESIEIILEHIKSNIIALSLHKFGSNVIEKSLRIDALTDRVMEVLLNNSDKFPLLLNDPYGNYVLQTSLDMASSKDLAKLAVSLQPLLPGIKNTPHGRRILTKIQNIV